MSSDRNETSELKQKFTYIFDFSINDFDIMSELVELGRKLKRSLDGYITYRKAAAILCLVLVFFLYLGPGVINWLLGRDRQPYLTPLAQCVADKVTRVKNVLDANNGHSSREEYLSYVGNGYFGLSVSSSSYISIKSKRTLSIPVHYKPLVHLELEDSGVQEEKETVTDYLTGVVTQYKCVSSDYTRDPVSVTTNVYSHRTIPGVLVQDIKVYNPTDKPIQLSVEKLGIQMWDSAVSATKVIEHGEGGVKYSMVTGSVEVHDGKSVVVAIVSKKLPSSIEVQSRVTYSLHLITGIAYSDHVSMSNDVLDRLRGTMEKEAISSVKAAAAMTYQKLAENHSDVWRKLWTSGFGISYSYAENAINGERINATIYYVLSHSPTLLDSTHTSAAKRSELYGYLSYTEGCYSGIRTLQARNLWTPLTSLNGVDTVVSYWLLNLEKNGCHNLVRAGADGVMQAMVLSLPGLKFSNHHLELNVHPRELHRDLTIRRVNYGNETHINISIHVMDDNKAAMFLSLDKRNKDYYACDAGCLDPPVKLGPEPIQFPVKLTDPLTAILYVTADQEHMNDLKHTIHVAEVGEAPAHESHVLEMHRTGNRLGGLHPLFWVTIAGIIVAFHLFLFRLIYNEYCANDKYRFRKYSDYG